MAASTPDGRRPRVSLYEGGSTGTGTAAVAVLPPVGSPPPWQVQPPLLPFVGPLSPVRWPFPLPGCSAWAKRFPHTRTGVPLPQSTAIRQRPCLAHVTRPAAARTRQAGVARPLGSLGHQVVRTRRYHSAGGGADYDYDDDDDDDDDASFANGARLGDSLRFQGYAGRRGPVAMTPASSIPDVSPPAQLMDDSYEQEAIPVAASGATAAAAAAAKATSDDVELGGYLMDGNCSPIVMRIYSDVTKFLARGDLDAATNELVASAADAPLVLAIRIIRRLREADLPLEALHVLDAFDAAGRRPEFERGVYAQLFLLLDLLDYTDRLSREWAALDPGTMAHVNASTFRTVLIHFCKRDLLDEAIEVKRAMQSVGYTLARGGHNMFLGACARARRLPEAFEGLAEMAESGVTPDVITFNTLLNTCVRTEQLDAAFQLLDKMRAWGVEADNFTWNVLINGCRRQGLLHKAFALADEMEAQSARSKDGGVTGPDLVTYNTLLAGCARVGDAGRAMEVKRRLEAKGFVANATTYNSLMTACIRSSRLEDAFSIFDEMIARGLKPNREVFCTIINACARAHLVDRAAEVHAMMASSGIAPTSVTYNALLNAHRVVGDVDAALGVLEEMFANGVQPDVVSYSAVVDTLGRACRLADAFALVEDMRLAGVEPNLVTYTSLVAGCVRMGDMPRAEAVFSAIAAAGLKPNVYTYSTLVNGYGRLGQLGRALERLNQMRALGISPPITTYVSLLHSVGRRADESGLALVLSEMRSDKVLLEPMVWDALVAIKASFVEEGKPDVATQLDQVVAALREGGRGRRGSDEGLPASVAAADIQARQQVVRDSEDVASMTPRGPL